MSITRTNRWRLLFVAAGATMALGGPLHPESDAKDSLRDELATMTSGDTWVLSHSLIAIGTALLAIGLWSAYRSDAWPRSTRTALRVTAVTMSLYVIETIFHLASVVDSSALAAGDPAPIAFAHVGLALVLYPVSGLSFAWLSAGEGLRDRRCRGRSDPRRVGPGDGGLPRRRADADVRERRHAVCRLVARPRDLGSAHRARPPGRPRRACCGLPVR